MKEGVEQKAMYAVTWDSSDCLLEEQDDTGIYSWPHTVCVVGNDVEIEAHRRPPHCKSDKIQALEENAW